MSVDCNKNGSSMLGSWDSVASCFPSRFLIHTLLLVPEAYKTAVGGK